MCISFERSPNISGGQCKLADLLPTIQETQGWRLIQEEIGESPEMRRTIAELLNSDDAMALTFHKGAILIYLVHWRLGKLTHQLLASPTPDACWVRAGWCCVERSENADMVLADATDLKQEKRTMHLGAHRQTALFWHVVGESVFLYGQAYPPWHELITDSFLICGDQRKEQFFLRIS